MNEGIIPSRIFENEDFLQLHSESIQFRVQLRRNFGTRHANTDWNQVILR